MIDVVHIPVEGPVKVVKLDNSGDTTLLRGMQELVDGYIEQIQLRYDCDLWIGDESAIRVPRPPVNELATGIAMVLATRVVNMYGGAIFGPTFVAGRSGPETVDVNPAIMTELITMAGDRWEPET